MELTGTTRCHYEWEALQEVAGAWNDCLQPHWADPKYDPRKEMAAQYLRKVKPVESEGQSTEELSREWGCCAALNLLRERAPTRQVIEWLERSK